jgi:predicted ATPase
LLLDGEYVDANRPLIWDEPENHLHPEWQIEFAKVLVQIYKSGVPIIVTTHSPYFLQAIRFYAAKEGAEDFVSYYMTQPTGDGFVTMENATNDLNKVFKKLAAPLTGIMNIDAARQGIEL